MAVKPALVEHWPFEVIKTGLWVEVLGLEVVKLLGKSRCDMKDFSAG